MNMNEKMTKVYDELYDYILLTATEEDETYLDLMANAWIRSHNEWEKLGLTNEQMNYIVDKCVKEYMEA